MEALLPILSIVAWPIVSIITEFAKQKRNMDGHVAIAIVSLIVAVIYVLIAILVDPATIDTAIGYAGLTSTTAMTAYNFLKAYVKKKENE